jgi:hypothetical protein
MAGRPHTEQSLSQTTWQRLYIDISADQNQQLIIQAATLRMSKKALLQQIVKEYFDAQGKRKK